MNRKFIAVFVMILSVVIFYFFVLPLFDVQQFLDSLKRINIPFFLLALMAVMIANIAGSLRWSFLMKTVKAENSQKFFNALGIFSLGQVAGLIVPSRVGNYAKVPMVTKLDNLPYGSGLSAVNAETIFDLAYICSAGIVSLVILSSFFSTHSFILTALIFLTIVLLVGAFAFQFLIRHNRIICTKLIAASHDSSRAWFIKVLAYYVGKLVELILSTKDILGEKSLVLQLGFTTLITQLFGVVGLFLVIGSADALLPFSDVFALLTISYIIGIVSLIPGGFGASDLSLIVLFGSEGIPLAVATNIAILWRIAMYLPIFVIIGLFFIQKKISGKCITVCD
jgi:phosphatidylglycerol lysyltransferase